MSEMTPETLRLEAFEHNCGILDDCASAWEADIAKREALEKALVDCRGFLTSPNYDRAEAMQRAIRVIDVALKENPSDRCLT